MSWPGALKDLFGWFVLPLPSDHCQILYTDGLSSEPRLPMRALLRLRWRQDRLPLLLYLITFIVMTYPFVFHMHDSLPMDNPDTHTALWQNWWLREALLEGKSVSHSELLFHPTGLDLSLQPRRWASFPLWTLLYTAFGDPLAFNLVAAIGILFKAYGMYLFGLTLFKRRIPAWVCGGFYSFAAPALALALQQPNTGATEWMPWFMLAFASGLASTRDDRSSRPLLVTMVLAGLLFSLNVYSNLKIGIFALLLGGSYLLCQVAIYRLWRRQSFWLASAVFTLSAIVFTAPLLASALSSDGLQNAIQMSFPQNEYNSADLLSYVKADNAKPLLYMQSIASLGGSRLHVLQAPLNLLHLGVASVAFAFTGAIYILRTRQHGAMTWLVIAVIFWLFSFGTKVYLAGELLEIISWTPFRLVEDIFLIRALRNPWRMTLVWLFAYSVLIGYGLDCKLRSIDLDRRQTAFLVVSVLMLFFGTSVFPIPIRPAPRPHYLSVLAGLPEGAVIDAPFGRDESKFYMSVQRFHARPIVEGMIARMPPDAYDYIDSNLLLTRLSDPWGPSAVSVTGAKWRAAIDALKHDGFRYLILHERVPFTHAVQRKLLKRSAEEFAAWPTVYDDGSVRIYDLWHWEGKPIPMSFTGGFSHLPDGEGSSVNIGESFTLHIWSLLDSVDARPCQAVTVESWWSIDQPNPVPHSLLLILADSDGDGQLALVEKAPADRFTTEWHPGVYYRDQTAITIPCAIADGSYPLLLGMKESMSGNSLPIHHADGSPSGSLYYLTTLEVVGD